MSEVVQVKAIAKGIRISPRKVGEVAALVRRRSVGDALVILEHTQRKAAQPVVKVINSAVANARHNLRISTEDLEIHTIMVTEGMTMKRYKFVGTGRRARPRPMLKRSSHITVVLSGKAPAVKAEKPQASKKTAPKTTVTTAKAVKKAPAKKEAKK